MTRMHKKLMEGLGLSAAICDADAAGYLRQEEAVAIQRARIDYGAFCEGLAAEYLCVDGQALLAKERLRRDINQIEVATDTRKFDPDEAALFEQFAAHVDERIDRLAKKNGFQRSFILWFFRTPGIVKALILAAVVFAIAIAIGRFSEK